MSGLKNNSKSIKYITKEQGIMGIDNKYSPIKERRIIERDDKYLPIVEKIREFGVRYVGKLTDVELELASGSIQFFDKIAKSFQKNIEGGKIK